MPKKRASEHLREQWQPYKSLLPGTRKMISRRFKLRDKKMELKDLTVKQLEALADAHIKMYTKRLEIGTPPVNVSETSRLLKIWQHIQGLDPLTMGTMSVEEREEVEDALYDGSYDSILEAVK